MLYRLRDALVSEGGIFLDVRRGRVLEVGFGGRSSTITTESGGPTSIDSKTKCYAQDLQIC